MCPPWSQGCSARPPIAAGGWQTTSTGGFPCWGCGLGGGLKSDHFHPQQGALSPSRESLVPMARDPGSRLVCFLNFEARLQPYITEYTGQTVLANATRCPASPAIVLLVNRQRARVESVLKKPGCLLWGAFRPGFASSSTPAGSCWLGVLQLIHGLDEDARDANPAKKQFNH
jgi:hypothetical protein